MKTESSTEYTEEDMEALADDMTYASAAKAEKQHRDEMNAFFGSNIDRWNCLYSKNPIENALGEVLDFLKLRTQQMNMGQFHDMSYSASAALPVVLAFDMHYSYDNFSWNGESLDPNDDPFNMSHDYADSFGEQKLKSSIVGQLEQFLLAGAALAKSLGSDVYPKWRKALEDLVYTFNGFENGCDLKVANEYWNGIREAARQTAVDYKIAAYAKTSPRRPSRKIKLKKNAKK